MILKTQIFRVVAPCRWVNSSNLTENTLRLYYEVQSVNITLTVSRCLLWLSQRHKCSARAEYDYCLVRSFVTLQLPESVRAPSPVPRPSSPLAGILTPAVKMLLILQLASVPAACCGVWEGAVLSQTPPCCLSIFLFVIVRTAGPSGSAVWGVVLRPLAGWDCGFESHRGHGCLLWVLCVVRWRSLRRADHSSRGVQPTLVSRCVWSRNLVNEEALARWGLSRQ